MRSKCKISKGNHIAMTKLGFLTSSQNGILICAATEVKDKVSGPLNVKISTNVIRPLECEKNLTVVTLNVKMV